VTRQREPAVSPTNRRILAGDQVATLTFEEPEPVTRLSPFHHQLTSESESPHWYRMRVDHLPCPNRLPPQLVRFVIFANRQSRVRRPSCPCRTPSSLPESQASGPFPPTTYIESSRLIDIVCVWTTFRSPNRLPPRIGLFVISGGP